MYKTVDFIFVIGDVIIVTVRSTDAYERVAKSVYGRMTGEHGFVTRRSWKFLCSPLCTRGADKSLVRPTSRCILFEGENISFAASLVIYIYIYIYIYIVLIFIQL